MIGLDTNILARYIVRDDSRQFRLAEDLIDNNCSGKTPCFISLVVLVELVWLLDRSYGFGKSDILTVIQGLVRAAEFTVEQEQAVVNAYRGYQDSSADFADALIVAINEISGCEKTVSFDKKMTRLPGVELLK